LQFPYKEDVERTEGVNSTRHVNMQNARE